LVHQGEIVLKRHQYDYLYHFVTLGVKGGNKKNAIFFSAVNRCLAGAKRLLYVMPWGVSRLFSGPKQADMIKLF